MLDSKDAILKDGATKARSVWFSQTLQCRSVSFRLNEQSREGV